MTRGIVTDMALAIFLSGCVGPAPPQDGAASGRGGPEARAAMP